MIELIRGKSRLTLLPEIGGAVGEWQYDGQDVFLPTANPALRAQNNVAVGAYPLVPYSNRIARGHFSFGGRDFQLADNMTGTPHTIHGNGWEREWTVAHKGENHVVLTLDHVPAEGEAGRNDPQWPFAYRAVLSYVLRDRRLEVELAIENRDTADQPVGFGFHPFLAAQGAATLAFEAKNVWLTTADGLPVERKSCEGQWSFRTPVDAHARAIDNCFAGFGGRVDFAHDQAGIALRVEADPVFGHLVVFTAPDAPFVAVEPVTNMTDAINHAAIADRGLHILKPGARVGGAMRFEVSTLDG